MPLCTKYIIKVIYESLSVTVHKIKCMILIGEYMYNIEVFIFIYNSK